jgi:hypothetical protein
MFSPKCTDKHRKLNNKLSDVPVMRVSNDNGATFGPMLRLATNGTLGEVAEEPEEGE